MNQTQTVPSVAEAEYIAGQNLRASHEIMSLLEKAKTNVDEMLNRLPDLFVIVDTKGLIWKGNQAAADIFEVGREDLIKTHFSRLFEAETWKVMRTKLKLYIEDVSNSSSVEFELPLNGLKGMSREFFWNIRMYESGLPRSRGLICILGRDVSQIRGYQRQMSQIFFSIPLGILTMDRDGVVIGPYSAYTEHLLGQDHLTGKSLKALLFDPIAPTLTKAEKDSISALFDSIGSDETWFNSLKVHFPIELPFQQKGIHGDKSWLGMSYHPICHGDKVDKVLVVIEDRTAVVHSRAAAERQKSKDETVVSRVLEISHCDEQLLNVAFEEFSGLYERLDREFEAGDMRSVCNTLHAIKGIARTTGFTRLKGIVHELEDLLLSCLRHERKVDESLIQVRYVEVKMEWRNLESLHRVLGHQVNNHVSEMKSDRAKRQALEQGLTQHVVQPLREILGSLQAAQKDSIHEVLNYLGTVVDSLNKTNLQDLEDRLRPRLENTAERLNKKVALKAVVPDLLIASSRFLQLIEILTHLLNNAVDHGIEAEEERKMMGKVERGLIRVEIQKVGDTLTIVAQDDGKGMSPDGLKRTAIRKGLLSEAESHQLSDQEALALVLKPGFSTASTLTDISGRGIGLDAVVESIARLGGKGLQIQSTVHKGSRFEFTIPVHIPS